MTGVHILAAMGFLVAVTAVVLWAALRASSKAGAAEERADNERAQADAIKRAADDDRATLERMANADAASRSDTVERARERMRKRPANTR